jgi:hypothetical protein
MVSVNLLIWPCPPGPTRLMVTLTAFTVCSPDPKDYFIAGMYRTDKRGESLKKHKEGRHSGINTSLRAVGITDGENLRRGIDR